MKKFVSFVERSYFCQENCGPMIAKVFMKHFIIRIFQSHICSSLGTSQQEVDN